METKTLIQAQANVLRLTALKIGDVVKIVDKSYSTPEIKYAVVADLLNSGKESYIQLLQFKKSWSEIDVELKTYDGNKDIAIFPSTIDEIKQHFGEAVNTMKKKIIDKKKEVLKEEEALERMQQFIDGTMSKKLTNASFKELTQAEYKEECRKIEEARKELENNI